MYLRILYTLLLISIFTPVDSFASSNQSLQINDHYQFTISLCKSATKIGLLQFSYEGLLNPYVSGEIKTSKRLQSLMASDGFYQALSDCYPNDSKSQDRLAMSLVAADVAGQAVGYVGPILAVRALLHWGKALNFVQQNVKLFKGINLIVNTATVGLIAYLGYYYFVTAKFDKQFAKDMQSDDNVACAFETTLFAGISDDAKIAYYKVLANIETLEKEMNSTEDKSLIEQNSKKIQHLRKLISNYESIKAKVEGVENKHQC